MTSITELLLSILNSNMCSPSEILTAGNVEVLDESGPKLISVIETGDPPL